MTGVFKKGLAFILILTLAVITLAGCSQAELDYIQAIKKTADWKSYDFKGNMAFDCKVDNAEAYNLIDEINLGLKYDGKVINNENGLQSYVNLDISILEINFNIKVWLKGNSDKEINQIIIRAPKLFRTLSGYSDKEYLILDYSYEVPPHYKGVNTYNSIPEINNKMFTDEYIDKIYDFIAEFNPNMTVVEADESQGTKTYSINFDDKKLKDLIKYVCVEIVANESLQDVLKELAVYVVQASNFSDNGDMEDIEYFFQQIKDYKEEILETIESTYTKWLPINLIGKKGIRETITTDEAGNIKEDKLNIHFNFDEKQIAEALDYKYADENKIDINISSETLYSNVDQQMSIAFPTLTKANSFNLLEKSIQDELEYFKICYDNPVVYKGSLLYFDEEPVIHNSRLMVSLQDFEYFYQLDWVYYFNNETNTLEGYNDEGLIFEISYDNFETKIHGNEYEMPEIPYWSGENLMVPIRFIGDVLRCNVFWDAQTDITFINY